MRECYVLEEVIGGVNVGAEDSQHSGLPGSVLVEGVLEVVSVSVDLLSLGSQMNTVTAIFLDLLSATFLLGSFFVFTSIFLDSTCVFWVALISGSSGAAGSAFCFHSNLLRLVPAQ